MASLPVTDWMTALDGELDLSLLTIPGTHDSGARLGGAGKQTQTMDIAGQLAAGIRFFDVRLVDQAGTFRLFHGDVDQQTELDAGVLGPIMTFLGEHPGEAAVMSVKKEDGGDEAAFARDFEAVLAREAASFHTGPEFPRLGDVRGKIVLLRRFAASSVGIAADPGHWPNNATFDIASENGTLTIEDHWDLGRSLSGLDDKWAAVAHNLETALGSALGWYITFTSGVSDLGNPRWIAGGPPLVPIDGINKRLLDYVGSRPGHQRLGTIVLDFPELPDGRLIQRLVDANG